MRLPFSAARIGSSATGPGKKVCASMACPAMQNCSGFSTAAR